MPRRRARFSRALLTFAESVPLSSASSRRSSGGSSSRAFSLKLRPSCGLCSVRYPRCPRRLDRASGNSLIRLRSRALPASPAVDLDALDPHAGCVGVRDVVRELDLDRRALGDRAGGRPLEVLAEVLLREVGERAAPDTHGGDPRRSLVGSDLPQLPHQAVHQRLLVHQSSASTRSTTSSTALATAGVSSCSGGDPLRLDPVEDDPAGQPSERPRQLDRLADAQRVRRRRGHRRRDRLGRRVDPMDGAGGRARADRVDEQRLVGAVERLDQRDRLPLQGPDLHAGRHALPQELRRRQPRRVVPLPGVPDPEDELQRRSTSSWRKCVAQEMQGSWLRIACSQRRPSSSSGRSA